MMIVNLYACIIAGIHEFYYFPTFVRNSRDDRKGEINEYVRSQILGFFLISARIVLYWLIESGRRKSVKMLFQAFEVTLVFIKKLSIYAGLRCFTRCTVKKYNTIFYSLLFLYPAYIFYFRIGQFAEERLRLFDIPDKSDISAVFERLSEYFRLNCL